MKNYNYVFAFYIISPRWNDVSAWNLSISMTKLCSSYIVNTLAADDLVMQEARA